MLSTWTKEPGARVAGSHGLDASKVQAPCIVRRPEGGFRLFYTAVGPERPFPECQGYLLSAVSDDGVNFEKEPGIRLCPDQSIPHVTRRILAPSIHPMADGQWRMYFESRATAKESVVIASAVSDNQLDWEFEPGIRLQLPNNRLAGPRFLPLENGTGRLFCCSHPKVDGFTIEGIISAVTSNGLDFEIEHQPHWISGTTAFDSSGVTAGEVIPPKENGQPWHMIFSAWESPPADSEVPLHPAQNMDEEVIDFAAASIASDMSGYRSRILVTQSLDGKSWGDPTLCIEGEGYGGDGVDAVHAEDMSLIELEDGRYRMYYAACDAKGEWCVTSAVSSATS